MLNYVQEPAKSNFLFHLAAAHSAWNMLFYGRFFHSKVLLTKHKRRDEFEHLEAIFKWKQKRCKRIVSQIFFWKEKRNEVNIIHSVEQYNEKRP